MLQVTMLSDTK